MNTTKKYIALLIALSIIFLTFSCAKLPEKKLYGEWMGTDSTGQKASLLLNEDGAARLIHGNMVLDGTSIGGSLTWKIDSTYDPLHLDLVMTKKSGKTKTLPMIVRFLGENKLQARIGDDINSRPLSFSDSDGKQQIILTRQ